MRFENFDYDFVTKLSYAYELYAEKSDGYGNIAIKALTHYGINVSIEEGYAIFDFRFFILLAAFMLSISGFSEEETLCANYSQKQYQL